MTNPHPGTFMTPNARRERVDSGSWSAVLQDLPLFSTVPKRHLKKIAALTREARFSPGTAIVRKGERGDDFFVILDGEASIVRGSGLPPITLGQGAHFGEMSLIDGGERSATVVAKTEMHCLRLSRTPFLKMLKGEPEITLGLLQELTARIRELQARSHLAA